MSRLPVRKLWVDTVSTKPVYISWSEALGEDREGYTYYESVECSECGKHVIVTNSFGEQQHRDVDDESHCQGYLYSEGPMMDYYYPLDDHPRFDAETSARLIRDLPLCLVELTDTWALALTGGGMDLSWEICEAFMRLGFLPPLHFTDLPRMSGKRLTPTNRWIIAGCRRSTAVAEGWAKSARCRLRSLSDTMKAEAIRKAA